MKLFLLSPLLVFVSSMAWSQIADGSYEMTAQPWPGDYLPTTEDQLVGGEGYHDYPGPFPKMLAALGLDVDSETVAFELQHHVDRDAPSWFGVCHGWALASILYPEPGSFVVNGVKLLPGDLKSILTSIHKNKSTQYLAPFRAEGVSAAAFHSLVENRMYEGQSFVFDLSLSDAVWNYPLGGFEKSSTVEGSWTNVSVTLWVSNFQTMNDRQGNVDLAPFVFTYRYQHETQSDFEWTGDSIEVPPKSAWIATIPYRKGFWSLQANHFFNLETYQRLEALSQAENNNVDRYEPNNAMSEAFEVTSEVILGSALEDEDYYKVSVSDGEIRNLTVSVYDGPLLDMTLLNAAGDALETHLESKGTEFQLAGNSTNPYYYIVIKRTYDYADVFYTMVHDRAAGSVRLPAVAFEEVTVQAVNTSEEPLYVSGVGQVPVSGSGTMNQVGGMVRSNGAAVWSVETRLDGEVFKKQYHRDHDLTKPYILPHMSFKFGWDTLLDLVSQTGRETASITIYGKKNRVLQTLTLAMPESRFFGSLKDLLEPATRAQGVWFQLFPESGDRLIGDMVLRNDLLGVNSRFDVESQPRIGDLMVADLKSSEQGWTGIALLSTAEVENEIYYSVVNSDGDELIRDSFMMQPGDKWLFTPKGLLGADINNRYLVKIHSQYTVEGLVIQHDMSENDSYGHRILGDRLDLFQESYLSVGQDLSNAYLLFSNLGDSNEYVLMEGYDALGEKQGRFNLDLRSPLRPGETRIVPVEQLRVNGVGVKDFDAITHFKIRTSEPVFGMEMVGGPGNRKVTPLLRDYVNP